MRSCAHGTYSLLVTATNQLGSARAASLAVSVLTTPPVFSHLTGGVVSPNGDGIDDTTTLSYRISRPCQTRIVSSATQPARCCASCKGLRE